MEILVEPAQAIAQFLRDQGYTEERLRQLGIAELPWNTLSGESISACLVNADARLELLIRAFCLGEAVEISQAEKIISKKTLRDFLESRLLARDGEHLRATCMLTHFGELIIACDFRRRAETGTAADLVLGVNPTTRLLARCSILRPGGKVLDLGTGCGTLALVAAPFAASVVGTDVNRRALSFAGFNAALNGLSNVSFLYGDRFEPVAGRRFDLIISNPPFFLAPVSGLLFCDNSVELDGFVESLVRSAPRFLEEGGVFQMLCEWVEFETPSWESRLRPWFERSNCDVHIWRGYEVSPMEYARKRALEQGQLYCETAGASFAERISYLTRRHVKSIFGGLITMRRRSEQNWFWVEEMQKRPEGPIGDALLDRFSTLNILESNNEQTLLAACPRLPAQVRLVSESVQRSCAWGVERSYLERTDDLPAKLGLDAVVAELAAHFDGTQSVETLLKKLAWEQKAPLERVIPEGLRVIRRLGEVGLIRLE
jgi:SAM-dependent methyltransferase